MAAAKTTTNHDEIKKWVEKNGGCPARVRTTGRGKGDPGILRIDYPGFSGQETLVKMNWDDWFDAFDKNKLAFVYQPSTRFSKLVSRSTVAARRTATAGRRGGAKKTATRTPKRETARRSPKRATTRATKRPTKRTTKRTTKRPTTRARRAA